MSGPRPARTALLCLLALIVGALVSLKPNAAAEPDPPANQLPPPAKRKIDFNKDIKPILAKHCVGCHGPKKQESGLRVDSHDRTLTGGERGVAFEYSREAVQRADLWPTSLPRLLRKQRQETGKEQSKLIVRVLGLRSQFRGCHACGHAHRNCGEGALPQLAKRADTACRLRMSDGPLAGVIGLVEPFEIASHSASRASRCGQQVRRQTLGTDSARRSTA